MVRFRFDFLFWLGGLFPVWVSNSLLAGFFLAVWRNPAIVGWDGALELQGFVVFEIVVVVVLVAIVDTVGAPGAFLSAIGIVVFAGASLLVFDAAGPITALLLALQLLAYSAKLNRDRTAVRNASSWIMLNFGLIALAWVVVSFVPLPAMGWQPESTPRELWWEVSGWARDRSLSYGLPGWSFLYFASCTLATIWYDRREQRRSAS